MFEMKKSPFQLQSRDAHENKRTQNHTLNDSPAMVLQRKRLDDAFGTQLQAKSTIALHTSPPASVPVVQAVTKIKHTAGTVDLAKVGLAGKPTVGTKMEAQLDVADPVIGTATGTQWQWTRALRQKFPQAGVVRGHLLNHDLGGNAIPSNLYPISTKANSEHSSKVEQPVKALLHEADANVRANNAKHLVKNDVNNYVHYKVTLNEASAGDPRAASFGCLFKLGPTGTVNKVTVPSNLGSDKDRYNASAGLIPGKAKISPHPNWAHTGKHTPTTTVDPKIEQDLQGNSGALPAFAKGVQTNFAHVFESLQIVYRNQFRNIVVKTDFARYSLSQDKVLKFILSLPAFIDDLEEFAVSDHKSTALPQFLVDLEDAVKSASHSVLPSQLPKGAWTPILKAIVKARSALAGDQPARQVLAAIEALYPSVQNKNIVEYIEANHHFTISPVTLRKKLKILANVRLITGSPAMVGPWTLSALGKVYQWVKHV